MPLRDPTALTAFIKEKSSEAGFAGCGIARAGYLAEEAPRLSAWLKHGYHGNMTYLENYFDKRLDPSLVMEGACSVICLLAGYQPEEHLVPRDHYRIARFALGKDYHHIIKRKLKWLAEAIRKEAGNFNYRMFTDSAPLLERAWAVKSGLGRIGKNACLIVPGKGSWFLLAEILCDLPLLYDKEIQPVDPCGNCTLCIEACPSGAIKAPRIIEARKCVSYLTTSLKEAIPDDLTEKTYPWIRGCDICQEVCPHNHGTAPAAGNWLEPDPRLASMKAEEWEQMTPGRFEMLFKGSSLQEAGYTKIMMTIKQVTSLRNE